MNSVVEPLQEERMAMAERGGQTSLCGIGGQRVWKELELLIGSWTQEAIHPTWGPQKRKLSLCRVSWRMGTPSFQCHENGQKRCPDPRTSSPVTYLPVSMFNLEQSFLSQRDDEKEGSCALKVREWGGAMLKVTPREEK